MGSQLMQLGETSFLVIFNTMINIRQWNIYYFSLHIKNSVYPRMDHNVWKSRWGSPVVSRPFRRCRWVTEVRAIVRPLFSGRSSAVLHHPLYNNKQHHYLYIVFSEMMERGSRGTRGYGLFGVNSLGRDFY